MVLVALMVLVVRAAGARATGNYLGRELPGISGDSWPFPGGAAYLPMRKCRMPDLFGCDDCKRLMLDQAG